MHRQRRHDSRGARHFHCRLARLRADREVSTRNASVAPLPLRRQYPSSRLGISAEAQKFVHGGDTPERRSQVQRREALLRVVRFPEPHALGRE